MTRSHSGVDLSKWVQEVHNNLNRSFGTYHAATATAAAAATAAGIVVVVRHGKALQDSNVELSVG